MYFLIDNNNLLKKYKTIWTKVSADIKKELDSKLVYDTKILKTKIKSQVIDFCDREIYKADSNHTCLAVISLESAL